MTMKKRIRQLISSLLVFVLILQLCACGSISDVAKKAKDTAVASKDTVVEWFKALDLSKFKDGWNTAVEYMGNAYSSVVTSQYVDSVGQAINALKTDINAAYGSARSVSQEAGFAAEKWIADTFNIDSAARNSSYKAEVVGSNELGSVDVTTNYGEDASLKYYQNATGSAQAQAESLIEAYRDYCNNTSKNPMTLKEYMDKHGYDSTTQDDLLASIYKGQSRIIPADQLSEAKAYLEGRITKLSAIDGDVASARTKAYQETLANLKDRLEAPDGTQSKPASYEEMQAIAELAQNGEFDPKDFGITLSQAIPPKYVIKQAMGTGFEAGMLRTVFTVGPDLISIVIEAVKNGKIDEKTLEDTGIEGAIAFSEGFVEGAASRIVVTLREQGVLGEALKQASPNVIGALVFLMIEAMISAYSLVTGEITAEEYGILMADKTMITALAIPVSAALIAVLPGTKLFMLIGCLAGGVIASTGYTIAKEVAVEFIDGGGFEAIVPTTFAARISSVFNSAKEYVSEIDLSDHVTNLKDFAVSTANDGVIWLKGIFD